MPDALDDPEAEFDVTLMLLSETDQTYEVGRLPGPYPRSYDVQDLSPDGRTALVASYGDEATSYTLLDLPTMSMTSISTSPAAWRVQFGNDDRSLLIEEQFTTPQPSGAWLVDRITLSRAALDGTDSQQFIELSLTPEQQEFGGRFSYAELDSGEFATTEAGTVWLRSRDGQPIRQLQAPAEECTVVRQWSDGIILARCPDASASAPATSTSPTAQRPRPGLPTPTTRAMRRCSASGTGHGSLMFSRSTAPSAARTQGPECSTRSARSVTADH